MKSIEEEIKQKKFPSVFIKTDVNLLFTSSWLNISQTRFFKKYSLSMQQYNVLRILRGKHPESVMLVQISDRMIDKMSNATRLVDKLIQKELATRTLNKDSRRQVDINITEKGLELLARIDVAMNTDLYPTRYKNISEQELEVLNDLLDKLRG